MYESIRMRSLWILGVVSLLSAVELEAARFVRQISCPIRNLTVTADDHLSQLYFDGVEITDLPNADIYSKPDVATFSCTTRLIAIHVRNGRPAPLVAKFLASTDDEFVLTNSTWKCSNVSHPGWDEIGFDDSSWTDAKEYGYNGKEFWGSTIHGIRPNAQWIWLRKWNGQMNSPSENTETDAYCRKRLAASYCLSGPCAFGGTCVEEPGGVFCICAPGYTGQTCSIAINYCESDPCSNGGSCLPIADGYFCQCLSGFTGEHCEIANYNESLICGTMTVWAEYPASNDFTRLCYFSAPLSDPVGRATECRDTVQGIPLYVNATGLLNAGGNFGCLVSLDYPEDLPATSYIACNDDYQHDVSLGNYTESAHMMVCLRYPYDGIPSIKQQ